jgi:putative hydrolase of the HAD superfamily
MNKKINTLIFDCFGVICGPVYNAWYRDNISNRGLEDKNLLNIFSQHDLGILSESDIVDYFYKLCDGRSTKEKIEKEINDYLILDEKLANIILKLKSKGFKTELLSNARASFFEQRIYKKFPQFKGLFDKIVISSDVQIIKPDNGIYLYALDKIKSKPEECLFVDDNKANVDGALALGIESFLYTDVDSFVKYLNTMGIDPYN